MTAVGHNDTLWTNLTVLATGAARDYADKAAMVTAGYALTAYDELGAALGTPVTWDRVRSETNGDHMLNYAVPLDAFGLRLTVPAADFASVALWNGIGYTYGLDDIGGFIATSGSVAITPTITTDTATVYDGDSLDVSVSITEAALASIGAASLTACDTRRATIKLDSANSGAAPTVPYTDLTVTITTDTVGNRVLRIVKDAFPTALAVPNSSTSVACTLQMELGEGTKVITAASVAITVLWGTRDNAGV